MSDEAKIESKPNNDESEVDEEVKAALESHGRVITVRLNGWEHYQLMAAAHKEHLSLNKYCLSKLIPGWVDPEVSKIKQRINGLNSQLRERELQKPTANQEPPVR